MSSHTPRPGSHEVSLQEEEFIVSKTDPRGRITYVNRIFMTISGFSEGELLGQPHNMIRHPDMPRGVFKFMWDTLQAGDEFFGYVKNLCKDGSYYWVFANVTPDLTAAGQLRGYYSVRRKPAREGIAMIEPIYQEMLKLEASARNRATVTESLDYLQQQLDSLNMNYVTLMMNMENRG